MPARLKEISTTTGTFWRLPTILQTKEQTYAAKAVGVIALANIVRLVAASGLELGNDEAYYWLYSQHLQWNYFDHPPMIALWIRLFTLNLLLQFDSLFVRFGSLIGAMLASLFIYKAATRLHSPRAGFFAVLLYNASFYAGITAGTYSMPDSPQMVFWTLSLWQMSILLSSEDRWINWLVFGAAAGLCIMSKVHGIFLCTGLILFAIAKQRSWLRKPQFYTALLLALVISSPIFFWNLHYHFETYRFHSQRITVQHFAFNARSFFREVGGQFFFNNPFNVLLYVGALWSLFRSKTNQQPRYGWLFVYTGLPLGTMLLLISVFRDTLPHWSGPAYVSLIPLAACWLAQSHDGPRQKLAYWAFGSSIAVLIALVLFVNGYPGTVGRKAEEQMGKGDVSLDMYGWRAAGAAFRSIYASSAATGATKGNTPVVIPKWWGAHLDYYFCAPAEIPVIGLGGVANLHQYTWMNEQRGAQANLDKAFCIVPSDEWYPAEKVFAPYYSSCRLVNTIHLFRNGHPVKLFRVYLLSGWHGQIPLP